MQHRDALFALGLSLLSPQFATGAAAPVVLAESRADFDGDGQPDTLALVWSDGTNCIDDDAWCGQGPKYTGSFLFRVSLSDGRHIDTPLASLQANPMFLPDLPGPPWPLVLADLNADGRLDLNLGSYAGCLGLGFQLFTVSPDGRVHRLCLPDTMPELYVEAPAGWSTTRFTPTDSGFAYTYFSLHEEAFFDRRFTWDTARSCFAVTEVRRPAL